jgi:cell division protein FtsI (penicillin-binding protein 3)
MKAKDAIYLAESLGLRASLSGRGYVRSQSLKAGSELHKGDKINLQLSIY